MKIEGGCSSCRDRAWEEPYEIPASPWSDSLRRAVGLWRLFFPIDSPDKYSAWRGNPLPHTRLRRGGRSLGHDVYEVRIHRDGNHAELARLDALHGLHVGGRPDHHGRDPG